MEFKSFNKIDRLDKHGMTITQKIHGSNAQVVVITLEDGTKDVLVGSRNRWITPENDNFGFARFVYDNKDEFISKLGEGRHFGEWAGPGINSSEGLNKKTLVLFDTERYTGELPPQTVLVPVLYSGKIDSNKIEECMLDLKTNGSKLVPGFMRPEGIVIQMCGTRLKKVFEEETTQWKNPEPVIKKEQVNIDHLLQPIRLQKLLSKDEQYTIKYPESLGNICKDYIQDLLDEGQMENSEEVIKQLKRELFKFVKSNIGGISG